VSVALIMQRATLMRRIMSSVDCVALPHFFVLSYKRYSFRGVGGGNWT